MVVKTGMETKVGRIAKIISEDEAPQTPIQRKLEEVRKKLRNSLLNNMWINICDRSV